MGTWLSMGPLASGVPMGASHGIGYVLGAEFGVPHGHTTCIMLPAVMRWNKLVNANRQAQISIAMSEAGSDAGDVLDAFIGSLDMPRSLGAVKIGRDNFERIAEQAMGTPWVSRNPRPIAGPAQVREILLICRIAGRFIGGGPKVPSAPFTGRSLSIASGERMSLARHICTAFAPSVIEPPPIVTMRSACAARAASVASMTA
jgi:hypothetical protein